MRPKDVVVVIKEEAEGIVQKEEIGAPPPETDEFSVGERGMWQGLDATKKHVYDSTLAAGLVQFFKNNVSAISVLELGAGLGHYAQLFKSEGLFISCYDGNPNTQELSEGRCAVIDLSKPVNFCKHDWVMSLEVGEHIPAQFEEDFIANLDNGNTYGLVLSWAIEGQGGTSHVNNRNNDYIKDKFEKLGYTSDVEAENALRQAATMGWFKNTIMVFHKN